MRFERPRLQLEIATLIEFGDRGGGGQKVRLRQSELDIYDSGVIESFGISPLSLIPPPPTQFENRNENYLIAVGCVRLRTGTD